MKLAEEVIWVCIIGIFAVIIASAITNMEKPAPVSIEEQVNYCYDSGGRAHIENGRVYCS